MVQKSGETQSSSEETKDELTNEQLKAAQDVGAAALNETEDAYDILDEIDDVLEQNAEEFVKGYIQKGGQ